MKFKILSLLAVFVTFHYSEMSAQDFSKMFDDAFDVENKDIAKLDSILAQWETSSPKDTDLAIAKYRRLMFDRYKPIISKAKNNNSDNDSTYTVAIDHVLDYDKISQAYAIIDKAIEENPDLYKLRQYKSYVNYKVGFNNQFLRDIEDAFKRQTVNSGKWIVDDSYYSNIPRDEIIIALTIGYVNDIMSKDSIDIDFAESLIDTGLKYYPGDYRFLNLYGIIADNYRYDTKTAIEYYRKGLESAPDDVIILLNLAHSLFKTGDNAGAIETAQKVIDLPDVSMQYSEEANEIIQYAKEEIVPVSLYTFEFTYAPKLAAAAKSPFQFADVRAIVNDRLPSAGFIPNFSPKVVSDSFLTFGDMECVLWTFDDPTEIPLCKYLAFIPVNGKYEVYTLEKTLPLQSDINWVIGHATTDGHQTLDGVKGFADGKDFVKYVIDNIISVSQ